MSLWGTICLAKWAGIEKGEVGKTCGKMGRIALSKNVDELVCVEIYENFRNTSNI